MTHRAVTHRAVTHRAAGGGGLTRLLCLATLAPETLGADVTGGRLDDVNQLAGAAARMLQPMVAEGIARTIPRVAATRRGARESLWRLLSSRSDRFDLGSADLRTARGLTAARQLSAGYRALANVNLLRQLLPTEGTGVPGEARAAAPPGRR